METKCSVVLSPDGHGGLFTALKDATAYEVMLCPFLVVATSKCLTPKVWKQDMKRRGVEYVFTYSVDNPLCVVADPVYIGYCIQRNVKMGYKVVNRRGISTPAIIKEMR